MFEWVRDQGKDSEKFAFGALFYDFLKANNTGLDIEVYEPEIYSGYGFLMTHTCRSGNHLTI